MPRPTCGVECGIGLVETMGYIMYKKEEGANDGVVGT